ncbi:glycosyltransferase family 4 protein [bacterium]|nr:glycosyltransferase family 4 protein [bacterium]
MKILQIVQKPQLRGAEMFAYQLSERFLREGHQVREVYLYSATDAASLSLRSSDVLIGEDQNHFTERVPGWNPKILKRIRSLLREFKPEVVQVNAARTVKYGALVSMLEQNTRCVFVYRNIGDPRTWVRGLLRKWFYRNFAINQMDGIVAVSRTSFDFLKLLLNGNSDLVRIPRAVEPATFVPKQRREKVRQSLSTPELAPVLVFVGSLTPEKRVDRLIRLLQHGISQFPLLQLWILGDGTLKRELETYAETLGVAGAVRFIGLQQDVASYVNAADLFVLSSETEGIPGVVLEAGLLGIPSIACNVGGVSDCILDGETGILVDPSNETSMIEAVVELLSHAGQRIEMGKKASNWVMKNFLMEGIAEQYLEFYKRLWRTKFKDEMTD